MNDEKGVQCPEFLTWKVGLWEC